MYDQGAVRQHVSNNQLTGGSASSVALPGAGKSATPILALPAPDGTVQNLGNQDPFAASLVVPPPAYVQIAGMEKKQHLLVQEQQLWQQYGSSGMQGQLGLEKIATGGGVVAYGPGSQPMMMPYGMPPVMGMGQPGGYYYTSYSELAIHVHTLFLYLVWKVSNIVYGLVLCFICVTICIKGCEAYSFRGHIIEDELSYGFAMFYCIAIQLVNAYNLSFHTFWPSMLQNHGVATACAMHG
ncbi:Clathrin assembly protein [Actinidia chinensis var. chinensis]|uniref:Clathrin assembly protein n=1 Tax=Actinidia chinensis var. chinensis TaxID=1590841 RepID=A0A2R6S1T6_ACTCC|nr:Clathrin assembly protein [Actinidia chinensis var. chinensis]